MFSKVLVANRGEIACRIITTLDRLGVASVAVYTDADAGSRHVWLAGEAVRIGEGPAATSYLNADAVVRAAGDRGAQAVHPGYGFLSENADFADACRGAGLAWIGPEPVHLRRFGSKHRARSLAQELGIPLLAGTGLLASAGEAVDAATAIGYPVILKPTAGGGGIGMLRCDRERQVAEAFASVTRLASHNFSDAGVFLERFVERARHIEVQVFGANGEVVALGERDCSAQRRHQKVIEEAPPVALPDAVLAGIRGDALRMTRAVGYRSAGTVEFIVDADRLDWAFLEVNTRLQVEHGVTELVSGFDLVEWMVEEAAGELGDLKHRATALVPTGAAIEVRVYAEDAGHHNRPQTGELTAVEFPRGARVDTWVEQGTEVTPFYDPLLAKILVRADDRPAAVEAMNAALHATVLEGLATNADFVAEVLRHPDFVRGGYSTSFLGQVDYRRSTIEVIEGGMQTTVQDHPGRLGYWAVGVPPSGPVDARSFNAANAIAGNHPQAAGLEIVVGGPTLRFDVDATVAVTGARIDTQLDGVPIPRWEAVALSAGSILVLGSVLGPGARSYLAVRGGVDVPLYLGSRATFLLGRFGGFRGRALASGDVLAIGDLIAGPVADVGVWSGGDDGFGHEWEIGVLDGPHGAPDFLTDEGYESFVATEWTVHHHSDRTGVRLVGPAPRWARADGGEAGLHPSNIHDTTYAVGAVDLTGDMPVVLGPDGPSLGGFVCPITVSRDERWKVGQLSAGDKVRFRRIVPGPPRPVLRPPVSRRRAGSGQAGGGGAVDRPATTFRRSGDECLLVEYGPNVLDLALRLRVHALMEAIDAAGIPGIEELAPGIRSLQVRFEPSVVSVDDLVDAVEGLDARLPGDAKLTVPSRIVHLPLSWDDPATRLAIDRYMKVVRDDAPWCPWNIEFIRRINGLDSVDDVRRIVFDASYLVLGLGDVYLGAPVATPLDPRHRLVTTKYNPARTWTPENAVGIGGAYLCVYGMEGPGGYQFVGRTVQMWNRHRRTADFPGSRRCLLRFFDQLRFYPVTAAELLQLRGDFPLGRHRLDITETRVSLGAYRAFLDDQATSISDFKGRQQAAFDGERRRWEACGEMTRVATLLEAGLAEAPAGSDPVPPGCVGLSSPVHGVVAHVVSPGQSALAGEALVVVEAMKMETAVLSPSAGTVVDVRCRPGEVAPAGRILVVIDPGGVRP